MHIYKTANSISSVHAATETIFTILDGRVGGGYKPLTRPNRNKAEMKTYKKTTRKTTVVFLFRSRIVFLHVFIPALLLYVYRPSTTLKWSFPETFFTYSSSAIPVVPWGLKPRNWTKNKLLTIFNPQNFQAAQLNVSLRHSNLPNSHLPTKEASFITSTINIPHLILPCSLDLDTTCVVLGLQNVKTVIDVLAIYA